MLGLLLAAAISCGAPDSNACQAQAVFDKFIAGQNDHDANAVAGTLWHSAKMMWARNFGITVYGFDNVMQAFQNVWTGPWKIDPLDDQTTYTDLGADSVQIVTPAELTFHDRSGNAHITRIRWAGIFVRTHDGWKLTSIFVSQNMQGR